MALSVAEKLPRTTPMELAGSPPSEFAKTCSAGCYGKLFPGRCPTPLQKHPRSGYQGTLMTRWVLAATYCRGDALEKAPYCWSWVMEQPQVVQGPGAWEPACTAGTAHRKSQPCRRSQGWDTLRVLPEPAEQAHRKQEDIPVSS